MFRLDWCRVGSNLHTYIHTYRHTHPCLWNSLVVAAMMEWKMVGWLVLHVKFSRSTGA